MSIDQLLLFVATLLAQARAFYLPIKLRPSQTWLSESVSNDSLPSVICVGDALFDCIANERGMSVSDMMGQGEKSWIAFPGGAPANVASACCKLGTSAAFVGCVGQDDDGNTLERLLRDDVGVDVTLLQRTTQAPTRRVLVTRSLEGDRAFGGFAYGRATEDFADCLLDTTLLQKNEKYESMMHEAKWIVCSTLSLAYQASADDISTIVKSGQESGARLCVDINWRPVFWSDEEKAREVILEFAKQANIVKLTDEEADWLFGITDALENPSKVHAKFPNAQGVLVTAGEKGASYSLWGASEFVDAFEMDIRDTTGAGDAFTAAMLHGLMAVDNLDDLDDLPSEEVYNIMDPLVRFASIAGALTCTKEGAIAAQPTMNEIEEYMFT